MERTRRVKGWGTALILAAVFMVVGAFVGSLWLEIRREVPTEAERVGAHWKGRRVRVEVLNGAGIQGLARRATDQLRARGFDVVYFGNAAEFDQDTSTAIARIPDIEPARAVADALGLSRVGRRPAENLYLDVTVILGRDWQPDARAAGSAGRPSTVDLWWGRIRRAARRLWPG